MQRKKVLGLQKLFSNQRLVRTALHSTQNDRNGAIRQSKYEQLMGATKLSLAPMMEYTDRHFRHVVRLISKRTLLYTEMVAVNAISHERRSVQEEFRRANLRPLTRKFGKATMIITCDDTWVKVA
ncbi:dihydrouridine synthase [Fragilaria crotonensis]|nr:dihydrouridine synthase [Fragilaria crotonensis]